MMIGSSIAIAIFEYRCIGVAAIVDLVMSQLASIWNIGGKHVIKKST